MVSLKEMYLDNNQFSGMYLDQHLLFYYICNLYLGVLVASVFPKDLVVLDLGNNNINSTIPNGLGNLNLLTNLDLSFNNFHGNMCYYLTSTFSYFNFIRFIARWFMQTVKFSRAKY